MEKIFRALLMFLYFSVPFPVNATIDVYGIDDSTASKIVSHCSKNIRKYIEIESQMSSMPPDKIEEMVTKYKKLRDQTIKQIKEYGHFNLVHISIIYYPDKNKRYTTIDIVPSSEIVRIPKSPKRKINKELALDTETKKLFKLWGEYNEENINLINKGGFSSKKRTCPVVHCTWGFDKKERIVYLPKFKSFANKNKKLLMNIIEVSPNDEERGDALFILAHSDDYQSTASFLFNYIDDASDLVRNNSMRVIGGILSVHKVKHVALKRILDALNYPLVADRNKAAYVLYNIAHNDATTHKQIITQSGEVLIKLLKLQQPNNHDIAYRILKDISRQNYSERDYQHWQSWLDLQNKKLNS
jgi:hypothetical protein